ncbi:alpha-2-macroglobulin family protein [Pseudorhodobacter ferrugineus]|uniref:alpha-2-macroglobulin family protein n=1 Tax=Pseudorhodobacter ferrugineus TaxID=77008 RepID=UPI0003B6CA11|nr:alpha-2-macroglobulin family protein [Pseudorhodobacter ferrugineus]
MSFFKKLGFGAVIMCGLALGFPSLGAAQDLIPEKRFLMTRDADLPGGDIASMFDTTLESCQKACTTNASCTALTFNSRNGSCFLKADPGAPADYAGAFSGFMVTAAPGVQALAANRATDLSFLRPYDTDSAKTQAAGLGMQHITGPWSAAEHLAAATNAETSGNASRASDFVGAALNITDAPADWAEYVRLLRLAGQRNTNNKSEFDARAFQAAINGYLRADNAGLRHTLLVDMAELLEAMGRGRDMVPALRLAQEIQPRTDTEMALDAAVAKFGFRVTEHDVQSDSARPRICVAFSDQLAKTADFEKFVQMDQSGLTVERAGDNQLCVEGVAHGERHNLTFRAGIPAADGQVTIKPVTITAYVRDRNPAVSFAGRAYVLPKLGDGAALPIESVNAALVDLTLYRVTDRNILRAIQGDYFGDPMPYWREDEFTRGVGAQIWQGQADLAVEVNKDMTTRLPMTAALAGQGAGIFALRAQIPGKASDDVAPAWQWFVVSDLGLTTLSGVDGLHVVVRSLGTAGAKPDVAVELLSRSNEVLATVQTDAQGYAMFPAALARGTGGLAPAMIVAKDGSDDMAFLSLTDPEFDLSDRGVEGREPAPPIDVFLTTDRGAYRAGETVYATALSRDADAAAITGLPLTAIVKRPDGVEYSRAQVADAGAGGHVFALPIAGSAPRGTWRLELRADLDAAPLAAQTFLVEDFLPERIDFTLTLPDTPVRLGDAPDMTVDAKYLFGAPGADLAIEGEVILRAAKGLAAFPDYQFGRADEPFNTRIEGFGGQTTDANGRAVVALTMPDVADPARPLELAVVTRIAEGSGRPVERRVTRALQPAAAMIGVKPMFDGVVGEGADAQFALLAVGPDEVAVPMAVKWELSRIDTRYQWYQEYGNWNWEPVTSRERVADGMADLGTDPVQIAGAVTWGEYELVVEQVSGGAAATSVRFYAGWYAPADVTSTPDTLELSLDKPAYKPGDVAQLRIVPRAAGTALISVLSNRLVTMKMVEVSEGENTIPLDVTDDWGAGVYVTASVLRPMDVAAGRNPARAMGLAHASIDPGDKALVAAVEVSPEVAPRGPMDVAIKVDGLTAGDTAYATIAAVDVGILNLTSFKSPDPKGHYFGQRKLGVGIRDVYGRLIDGLNGAEGVVRSGGDSAAQARLDAPPPTEELVAYFTGPVTVGADGYARATFDMPSFNGTVRIMAVVWSARGVGQATADVLVRDPVVVTASVPRFMAPGDESRVLLEIVHAKGPAGRMGLDVTANGLALGAVPSGFDLAEGGKAVFSVPVVAGLEGLQSVAITLTTPDGKQLTKTLQIPVQRGDPEIARTTRLELAAGQTFTLDQTAFDGFAPGSGLATMAVGPIARLDAPGLLAALDRYPYGCTEQITSRALPLIYFDQVAQAMQLKGAENISTRISQAVAEVLTNQGSEGGFGLWGPSQGDAWLDAYVTDFLSRAKAQGYAVPDIAFRSALDNLRNRVNYTADFDEGGEDLAYALMVLAREGAAAIGDLRYYADVKGDAFATPIAQAQLGAALASYGDQRRADAMFSKAGARIAAYQTFNDAQVFRTDYGSSRRDVAAVLTLAVEAGSNVLDRDALAVALRPNGRTLSTQEATWTLLAANALIDRAGTDGITLNGAAVDGPIVRVLKAGDPQTVAVANGSGKPATLTLTAYGVPDVPGPAGGNGYAITRSYFTEDGTRVSLADGVTAGSRYVVVLEVIPFGNAEARLMVADPLPAGFEIDNPNLLRGGDVGGFEWLDVQNDVAHSEFRQDRFLTAVDWSSSNTLRLAYVVRAVSPGSFHHPAASVEDMYRPDYRAQTDADRVVIAE